MSKLNKISILIPIIIFSLGLFISGCSESTTPNADNVTVSYTSTPNYTDNLDSLYISSVKVLIKDIKLNVANANEDSTNFKTGPFVLDVNLASNVTTITSAMIPAGSYDKIKFEIHKLESGEPVPDTAFAGGYSVVVYGTWNGEPFVYKSTKSAHQKINFPTVMPVTEDANNITIRIEPYKWFMNQLGMWIDPNLPENANDIDNNIKDNVNENFKAFLDNNRDGQPD